MAYVYTFAYESHIVFYVGKGEEGIWGGDRIKSHLQEASGSRIKVSRVAQTIRLIWMLGGKVIIRKVRDGLSDNQALQLEKKLIEQYGYEHLVNHPWAWHRHLCPNWKYANPEKAKQYALPKPEQI